MDNERVVRRVYNHLKHLGLEQNREKFSLPEAGHRGFAVDVGSVRGEVLMRVQDGGVQVARIPILNEGAIEDAIVEVGMLVQRKRQDTAGGEQTCYCDQDLVSPHPLSTCPNNGWRNVGTTDKGFSK